MFIKDLFAKKQPVFSLEIFPPKPDFPISGIYRTLDALHMLNPSFISVTYGAGGSNRGRTVEIAQTIRNQYGIESLAHLTCVGHSKEEMTDVLDAMEHASLVNILALRGDPPVGDANSPFIPGVFKYANELVAFIKERKVGFCLGAAAYPEGHPQSASLAEDAEKLKDKVDQGVDFLITQLFLDNAHFFKFIDRIRKAGIDLPVSAGIMPVLNNRIHKIIELSQAQVPGELLNILQKYDSQPEDMEKAGIEYAVNQINELIAAGVDGIHLYTMNKSEQSSQIAMETRLSLPQVR